MKTFYAMSRLGGIVGIFFFTGCSKLFDVWDPPLDRAVVGDGSSQYVDAPVYKIIAIDGAPVERERYQFGVDMVPGAIMRPGKHVFKVREQHFILHSHSNTIPVILSFEAVVAGGKRYSVIPVNGAPAIVADRKPNQPPEPTRSAGP